MIAKDKNKKPNEGHKLIAKSASAAFGGKPKVRRYYDEDEKSWVDILECVDSPVKGVTSYSTIGLFEYPIHVDGKRLEVRTEFVGACDSRVSEFSNCLSTAAFCVINSDWGVAPGKIFNDVISMYKLSATMNHILFIPPFLWDDRLQTTEVGGRKVAWLLAVPIAESEMCFAEREGVVKLEEIFEEKQIDIFNLDRKPVI